jgi:hypothetical protein
MLLRQWSVSIDMRDLVMERRRVQNRAAVTELRYGIHVVRGKESILGMRQTLIEFSQRCGQPGTMEDLTYFLSKPGILKRIPHLYLVVKRQDLTIDQIGVDDLMGVVLLYEYRALGIGIRAFATNDRSGRGTMLALPHHRLKVAAIASRVLLDRGAHIVMLSFRLRSRNQDEESAEGFRFPTSSRITGHWAQRKRDIAAYLPLHETYDATLASIGQKTRSNMRYYRRRAEAQLGCTLVSDVVIGRDEYLAFNRECMFAVPDYAALWRYDTQSLLTEPVMLGMKDKDGRWLGILGGRRQGDRMEILWQMNRSGLPTHSLSAVMRSYCIAQEIARGMKRLYIEGGTSHSLHHSFVKEELMDLVVVRTSRVASMMKALVKRKVSPDNELAEMLKDESMPWFPC